MTQDTRDTFALHETLKFWDGYNPSFSNVYIIVYFESHVCWGNCIDGIMLEACVAKGIKSRLKGSALTFEEKVRLCRRVLKTDALKPHHGTVLFWIFQTLEQKKIASKDRKEKKRLSLWTLLECVPDLEEALSKMGGISAETFINVVTPTESPEVQDCMWSFVCTCLSSEYLLLILSKNTIIISKVVPALIDRFSDKLSNKKNALEPLLQKLPTERDGDIDGLIISLSQGLDLSNQLRTFLCRSFFPLKHLEDWSKFLSLLFEVKDEKPPVSIYKSLEILKDPRIQLEVFLPRLFSSVNAKMSSGDVARLFVFFSYLLGFSQLDLIKKESIWIISSNKTGAKSAKKKGSFLCGMIHGLKEREEDKGLKSLISGEVTFLKWIQHLAKELVLSGVEDTAKTLVELIKLNSVVIEPLIGCFSCSLLFHKSKDFSLEFSFLIEIYAKLRIIPKLMAKTLIHLSQHPEIVIDSQFSLQDKPLIVEALSREFEGLVFYQCLELWKTLDYHLTQNNANALAFCDVIMDLFLSNCRLVDFSIPDNIIKKVTEMIVKTSSHTDKLPRSRRTLFDFMLLLKNVGRVDEAFLEEKYPPADDIQRIKWSEVHGKPVEVLSLDCESIQPEDSSLFTPYLDSNGMKTLAMKCLQNDGSKYVIDEDRKLQASIVELLEHQIHKSLKRDEGTTNFVEELNSILMDEKEVPKFGKAQSDVKKSLESYLQLPLEYLEGSLGDRVYSFAMVLLLMTEKTYSTELFQIISRVLFNKKLLPSFKTLDLAKVLIKLAPIPCSTHWKRTAVQLLASVSVRSFRHLSNTEAVIDKFACFFNAGIEELKTSSILLSELSRKVLDASNKNPDLPKKLFDSLATSHFERVSNLNNDEEEVIYLLLEGVSIVLKVNREDKNIISSWKEHVNKLFFFCIDDANGDSNKDDVVTNFLTSLCKDYKIFKKTINVSLIWGKLKSKKDFSPSEELLIEALFQIPRKDVLQELLSDILSMSKKNESFEDFCACIGLWQILVKAKNVPPEINSTRQEYIETLLNFYHSLVISDKLSNEALLKVLELEKAIFFCEKTLIKAESEASCLITSLRVQFKTPSENERFFELWSSVCELTYLALQRRSNIIVPRVPIILNIVRNLVKSLMKCCDQESSFLSEISLCTRRLERLLETFGRNKDDFTRVTPYLIADILSGFQNFKMHSEIKSNLISGLHWLFKLSDKHSTAFLASSLPLGLTDMFKDLYDDYTKNYKFAGRI